MELKTLMIVQFVLDFIILGVLLLLGRFYLNRKAITADFKGVMDKSMALIKEMEALGKSLQSILEEKRELTNRLIQDLDFRLHEAQLITDEIKRVTSRQRGINVESIRRERGHANTLRTIEQLLAEGLSKEEVARRLGLATGELELIMKLKSATEPNKTDSGKE